MGEELKLLESPADIPRNTYGVGRPKQYPCLAVCIGTYEEELFSGSRLFTRWKYIYLEDVVPLLEEIGRRGMEQDDGNNGDEGSS